MAKKNKEESVNVEDAANDDTQSEENLRYVPTEHDILAQHASGQWPPQITEMQLAAARLEGRLTDTGAERLAEHLEEVHGESVDPEDLQETTVGTSGAARGAATEEESAEAKQKFEGALDKGAGKKDTEDAKALDESKEKSGTDAQAEARKAQGAKADSGSKDK